MIYINDISEQFMFLSSKNSYVFDQDWLWYILPLFLHDLFLVLAGI